MATKVQPILPSKVMRAEYSRNLWSANFEDGVTVAELSKSDFWVHLAQQLEPLDHIEGITADGETYIELLVARVEKINDGQRTTRIPKVVVLHQVKLGVESKASIESAAAVAPAFALPQEDENVRNQQTNAVITGDVEPADADDDGVPDGYTVNFGGPTHKYRVIKDGVTEPLATGLNKKAAIAWAHDHAKKSA